MLKRLALSLAWIALAFTPLAQAAPPPKDLILATTTSTQDSGLLDVLVPLFERQSGYFVKTIAVGSGQAMAMGRRGEADVLLVHSPEAERKFIAEAYGLRRRLVMHNDFIVVGPPQDPAALKVARSAPEAFRRLARGTHLFVSRGDNSGTHAQEMKVWQAAGVNPEGQKWYQQTGLGMGQTLSVAAEKKGYALSDRGTFLALRKNLGLAILCEGDAVLLNVYHVIEVNPAKFPKVNAPGAKAFADFLVSKEAQALLATFGIAKFGSPLFCPDAGKADE
jgi:tungstate transport system substrate-binding protein